MAKTNILVLGGGFGGMHAAMHLEKAFGNSRDVEIALVNRDNYFVFQPMLPEVISGNVGLLDTVIPLQRLLPKSSLYIRGIQSADFTNRRVTLEPACGSRPLDLPYDHLVIALGTTTDFRTLPSFQEHAFPFKNLADAIRLRNHVIRTLEEANIENDVEKKRQLLTYVVVGGGFSGVEIAAELNDFVNRVADAFPRLDPKDCRVVLVQGLDRILKHEVSQDLAEYAHRILEKRGVEIHLNQRVETATAESASLTSGETILNRTLIATAPAFPHRAVEAFALPMEHGRILAGPTLNVQGYNNVWAVGDCARIPSGVEGQYCPPTGQYAVREGAHVAKNIRASMLGEPLTDFHYTEHGKMGALGHRNAIAQIFGRIHLSGWLAYFLWRTAYWWMLPGLDRKTRVGVDWFLDLFLPRDLVELNLDGPAQRPVKSSNGDT